MPEYRHVGYAPDRCPPQHAQAKIQTGTKMQLSTQYNIMDRVRIVKINVTGTVAKIQYEGLAILYQVDYWWNGEIKSTWLYEHEVAAAKANEPTPAIASPRPKTVPVADSKSQKLCIKFSHRYPKIHNQKTARLLSAERCNRDQLSDAFIEYDTVYDGGHFSLPLSDYILLVFLGNDHIPFTTARAFNDSDFRRYKDSLGSVFSIEYASSCK
jgi:hypothetical protein